MQHRLFTLVGAALALPAIATAQVTPIGPFVGDHSDGFETQTAGQFDTCLVGRMFNNNGDLCSATGSATMHVTGGWGFMCSIPPHSGGRLFGSAGGPAEFLFDTDITSFGGYFGTNSWASGNPNNDFVTVTFYDRNGGQIDSVVATVTADCQYNWNGWSSTQGIASVVVTNSAFGGGFVNLDDMEISSGPTGLGTTFCTSNTNSTGQVAECSAAGSAQVAANNVTLEADDLPLMSFGFFLASQTAASTPNPGGSQGILCLGGQIGRYVGPGQIQNSGMSGSISLAIDLTSMPQPAGTTAVTAGQTWRFQAWFRDSNPTVTSNFSNGLEIMFQ
ncbi:MAG: hypothetical protein R3F49_19120 [Planctomycetota bacterium]